ncbi:acyl-coenzyme A thioesterase 13 [Tetranychus urticae]|uniref:Acyl-coenzyme A thioesterase 13 n=1 Tax=Tetranychus urticae TaxID=32264 RepID=T1K454_TETUR|nr:acyl-coenzyme A thioesterase 13 [Tetranychus urticae]
MSTPVLSVIRTLMKKRIERDNFDKILEKVVITNAGQGKLTAEMIVGQEHSNRSQNIHGGLIATLIDVLSTLALASTDVESSPDLNNFTESASASVQLNVTYIRPVSVGQTLLIECNTLNRGRTMAYLSVDLFNKNDGKLIARGSHTKILFTKTHSE